MLRISDEILTPVLTTRTVKKLSVKWAKYGLYLLEISELEFLYYQLVFFISVKFFSSHCHSFYVSLCEEDCSVSIALWTVNCQH